MTRRPSRDQRSADAFARMWPTPAGRGCVVDTAVFDLDRTLVAGSSLVPLARELLRRGLIDRRLLARHAWSAAAFRRGALDAGRTEAVQRALLRSVAGRPHHDLAAAAHEVGTSLSGAVYPGARWLVERHLAAGHFCVLLTAAPQELASALAGALGFHRAIGTRLQVDGGQLTGDVVGSICHGHGKLRRLADELGLDDLAAAAAYGDSASDLPVLERAADPVAVNPDPGLCRQAAARGWPVLRFEDPPD